MKIDAGAMREETVARLCAIPFFDDAVALRPTYRKGPLERELCDVLVTWHDTVLLIQVKAAEARQEVGARDWDRWARKQSARGLRQAHGSVRAFRRSECRRCFSTSGLVREVQSLDAKHVIGIVICDYPVRVRSGLPWPYSEGSCESPVLCYSIEEFENLCIMLSTPSDLRDYLLFRWLSRDKIVLMEASELDVLAAYLWQRWALTDSVAKYSSVVVPGGLWNYRLATGEVDEHVRLRIDFGHVDVMLASLPRCRGAQDIESHPLARRFAAGATGSDAGLIIRDMLDPLDRHQRTQIGLTLSQAMHAATHYGRFSTVVFDVEDGPVLMVRIAHENYSNVMRQTPLESSFLAGHYSDRVICAVAIDPFLEPPQGIHFFVCHPCMLASRLAGPVRQAWRRYGQSLKVDAIPVCRRASLIGVRESPVEDVLGVGILVSPKKSSNVPISDSREWEFFEPKDVDVDDLPDQVPGGPNRSVILGANRGELSDLMQLRERMLGPIVYPRREVDFL